MTGSIIPRTLRQTLAATAEYAPVGSTLMPDDAAVIARLRAENERLHRAIREHRVNIANGVEHEDAAVALHAELRVADTSTRTPSA